MMMITHLFPICPDSSERPAQTCVHGHSTAVRARAALAALILGLSLHYVLDLPDELAKVLEIRNGGLGLFL